eukprot:93558-Pyramimonas_sp.AAC.1
MLDDEADCRTRPPAPAGYRDDTLEAVIRALDATQRDEEASGRARQPDSIGRSSISGADAQLVVEGLLREAQPQLEPGSWIARAIWLCSHPTTSPS